MLETDRLILRQWRDDDLDPWAALNADAEVMRFFPSILSRDQAQAQMSRASGHIEEHGFGPWVVERKADGLFLGFTGLTTLNPENPLHPGVEAGWRLCREAWGQGYASEAAAAALRDGFERVGLKSIVAFTAVPNLPSQAVMARIGMTRREDLDFDHPALPKGHVLERHVVWEATA